MSEDRPTSLTVAVLTFRRPRDIADALPLLVEQSASAAAVIPRRRILVVDNDPAGGARAVVEDLAAVSAEPIVYVHEVEPGISAARNRALAESTEDDLLVFIDDDERPTTRWLQELLALRQETGAAAVVGPVISRFDVEPDAFLRAGGFFERRRLPTGTAVEVAATNNLLLDLRVVRAAGLRFDEAAGMTGGEDTLFTRALHRGGGALVWCDEAVVHDIVPSARTTRRWVLLRALSSGNSWGLTTRRLARGRGGQVRAVTALHAQGLARVGVGGVRAVLGVATRNERHRARGLRSAARGAGMILGAWGVPYREYRRAS